MNHRILLVDDDVRLLADAQRMLESMMKAEVHVSGSVRAGLKQIHGGERWTAGLFDLVLPVGRLPKRIASSQELAPFIERHGGVTLAFAFQHKFPGTPMATWSALSQPEALAPFHKAGVYRHFSKMQVMPDDAEMLGFLKAPRRSKAVIRRIWDSAIVQPSVFGVGIDVKKLINGLSSAMLDDDAV